MTEKAVASLNAEMRQPSSVLLCPKPLGERLLRNRTAAPTFSSRAPLDTRATSEAKEDARSVRAASFQLYGGASPLGDASWRMSLPCSVTTRRRRAGCFLWVPAPNEGGLTCSQTERKIGGVVAATELEARGSYDFHLLRAAVRPLRAAPND